MYYSQVRTKEPDGKELEETVEFFSYKDHYMPARLYYRKRDCGYTHDQVWLEYGKKHKERKPENIGPEIKDFKGLCDYILTQVSEKEAEEIREKRKTCKSSKEVVRIFPEVYWGLLELRRDYDLGIGANVAKAIQETTKKVARAYDADKFIEREPDNPFL